MYFTEKCALWNFIHFVFFFELNFIASFMIGSSKNSNLNFTIEYNSFVSTPNSKQKPKVIF